MAYEGNSGDTPGYANYHYNSATGTSRKNTRLTSQTEEDGDVGDERNELYNTSHNDTERRRNGSKAEDFSQRALLLQTDSIAPFDPEIPDTTKNFEPASAFPMGSAFNVAPSNVTRTKSKSKSDCNPFKKKSTNAIYKRNNLYGTKNRKSSKQNVQVTLGPGGMTSTGLSFDKPHTSKKRPFCPSWQCLVLALAIGTAILLCAGLVLYFFVWQSILGKLVKLFETAKV